LILSGWFSEIVGRLFNRILEQTRSLAEVRIA